jgi:predicted DNA-binding transcriptional regulator AlpA
MPTKIKPNAMKRSDAADFCGISISQFGKMIRNGTMPKARDAAGAKIWLRTELEDALTALALDGEKDEECDNNKVFGIAT